MKSTALVAAAFLALTLAPSSARAQSLTLGVTDGLVTLDARGVSVSEILQRWSALADMTLVNGEKLSSAPVSMQFADVPERQALAMVLRNVGGYLLVSRSDAPASVARVVIISGSPGLRQSGTAPPPLLPDAARGVVQPPPVIADAALDVPAAPAAAGGTTRQPMSPASPDPRTPSSSTGPADAGIATPIVVSGADVPTLPVGVSNMPTGWTPEMSASQRAGSTVPGRTAAPVPPTMEVPVRS